MPLLDCLIWLCCPDLLAHKQFITQQEFTINASGSVLFATTFAGALSGNANTATTATSATTATNANNINVTNAATGVFNLAMLSGSSGNQPLYNTTGITINSSGSVLFATTFAGALSGNANSATVATTATTATNANNIITSQATIGNYYLPVVSNLTGAQTLFDTSGIIVDVTNSNIIASTFIGSLSGNAETASLAANILTTPTTSGVYRIAVVTNLSGYQDVHYTSGIQIDALNNSITASVYYGTFSGSISNASAVTTNSTTLGTYYLTMVTDISGEGQTLFDTSGITVNAATSSINATTFVGALSGNATTATTASGATTLLLNNTNSGGTYYLTFANNQVGNQSIFDTSGITVNPATASISATTFNGALNGNATSASGASTLFLTDTNANASFNLIFTSGQSGNQSIFDTAGITANPATSSLTATTFIGSLSGTSTIATNANNINMANTSSGIYYLPIVATVSGYQTLYDTSGITINASGAVLTATTFIGSLSGTATTATNANNINMVNTQSGTYYLPIVTTVSGSQIVYDTSGVIITTISGGATNIAATTFIGSLSGICNNCDIGDNCH
jgi:hypothetical protein